MSIIDIKSNADDPRAVRLSNYTARTFEVRELSYKGLEFGSIEGGLQGFKEKDPDKQRTIFLLSGKEAWRAGREVVRQDSATLFLRGKPFSRISDEYFYLLTTLYDAAYDQDPTFRTDLLATGHEELRHSIGGADQTKTILTEMEFLFLIYRLRARAHRDANATTKRPYLAHD